jgi:WD40 repeat protein
MFLRFRAIRTAVKKAESCGTVEMSRRILLLLNHALRRLSALTAVSLIAGSIARAADSPILRIEPGGHTARAMKVLFTPDGKQLVSVGEDKAVRIWDVETGQQVRTLRGQIGSGRQGRLFSAALSGDILAVAGDIPVDMEKYGPQGVAVKTRGQGFLLFSLRSGQIVRPPQGGHEDVITSLAFSLQGTHLASASRDGTASLWNPYAPMPPLKLTGHRGDVNDVAFSPDEKQVATAGSDGKVRIYDAETGKFQREAKCDAPVLCLAWSPDGKMLASGSRDGLIRFWNPTTGQEAQTALHQEDSVTCLAFSPQGQWLLSAGGEDERKRDARVHVWSMPDGQPVRSFSGHHATIQSVAFSADGRLATSADRAGILYVWDPATGEERQKLAGVGQSVFSVAWSQDGKQIAWGNVDAGEAAPLEHTFDLEKGVPGPDIEGNADFTVRARTRQNGRELSASPDGHAVILSEHGREKRFALPDPEDRVRCFSFTPKGDVVIGTEFYLGLCDGSLKPVRGFEGHDGAVRAVAVSGDGKYLASASEDRTVRIWRLDDAAKNVRPLISVFRSIDGEWVAWTPQGYYNASPAGDRLIGWQVNQGPARAALFYDAARFAALFYRPDVIYHLFREGSLSRALQVANANPPQPTTNTAVHDITQEIGALAAPDVQILDPPDNRHTDQPKVNVRVRLSGPNAAGASLRILLADAAAARAVQEAHDPGPQGDATLEVSLHPGRNLVRVYAVSKQGVRGLSAERTLYYDPPQPAATRYRTLHLLSVGVSAYPGNGLDPLEAPVKDAQAVVQLYKGQEGRLFERVAPRTLLDQQATRAGIEGALEEICRQAQEGDYVLVFVSGHGVPGAPGTDGTAAAYRYFFAGADFVNRRDQWEQTGLSWGEVVDRLSHLPCPVVLMVDTCHSGGIGIEFTRGFNPLNELLRGSTQKGLYVLASSLPGETSVENPAWGHGAFTKALLELPERAHRQGDGTVLFQYAELYLWERVRELVEGLTPPEKQTPKAFSPPDAAGDLPLLRAK